MKNAQLKQAAYGHVQVARVVGGESTHVFRKQQATPLANVGIYYTADFLSYLTKINDSPAMLTKVKEWAFS